MHDHGSLSLTANNDNTNSNNNNNNIIIIKAVIIIAIINCVREMQFQDTSNNNSSDECRQSEGQIRSDDVE